VIERPIRMGAAESDGTAHEVGGCRPHGRADDRQLLIGIDLVGANTEGGSSLQQGRSLSGALVAGSWGTTAQRLYAYEDVPWLWPEHGAVGPQLRSFEIHPWPVAESDQYTDLRDTEDERPRAVHIVGLADAHDVAEADWYFGTAHVHLR
jgi:hypothetical protein